jgi:hypothetical protein
MNDWLPKSAWRILRKASRLPWENRMVAVYIALAAVLVTALMVTEGVVRTSTSLTGVLAISATVLLALSVLEWSQRLVTEAKKIAVVWRRLNGVALSKKVVVEAKEKKQPLFVSELYARAVNGEAISAYVILVLCFFVTIATKDYVAAGIIGIVVAAIGGFGWLTKLRAKHGWFADNRYEVLELLHFIIAKSRSGGFPPGSRAGRLTSEAVQMRASSEETVGSRV